MESHGHALSSSSPGSHEERCWQEHPAHSVRFTLELEVPGAGHQGAVHARVLPHGDPADTPDASLATLPFTYLRHSPFDLQSATRVLHTAVPIEVLRAFKVLLSC